MQVKELAPIFFLRTKSFWLGIFPALLVLADLIVSLGDPSNAPVAAVIAWAVHTVYPAVTVPEVASALQKAALVLPLVVAWFRKGITRPYASTPAAAAQAVSAVLVKEVAPRAVEAVKDEVTAAVAQITSDPLARALRTAGGQ